MRKKEKLEIRMRNLNIRLRDVVREQKGGSLKARRRDLKRVCGLA